ncbi:MAG: VOC family protein [Myxococcota bacterium]
MARFDAVFPRFLVSNLASSLEFYQRQLGFRVADRVGDPPVFAIVDRDRCGLHLRQGPPAPNRDGRWDAYFEINGLNALRVELDRRGTVLSLAPHRAPYGRHEFEVTDPDGYVLCFSEEALGG